MSKIALAISIGLSLNIASLSMATSYVYAADNANAKEFPAEGSQAKAQSQAAAQVNNKLLGDALPSSAARTQVIRQSLNTDKSNKRPRAAFQYEPNLASGMYTYIVELHAPSVVEQDKLQSQLLLQNTSSERSALRISRNKNSENISLQAHLSFLESYQNQFIEELAKVSPEQPLMRYKYALNGLAVKMTQDQAIKLTENTKVKRISRERVYQTNTDRGPTLIGAPQLWQGNIGSLQQTQGEGIVIGIIDSGVNTDHPSFAEVSGDGYVHTNPLGDGVYLGDCAGNFAELCNNKLIGVYSYSTITNSYSDTEVFPPNLARNGEDYGGHGSHVAAIAAGNVLNDLPETLPTQGQEESSGTPTGFSFEQISGVAPRANIISYQACYGGRSDQDATYADCPGSAIIASLEDAIQDRVDVINFSISGDGDPWNDPTERAFLSAQSVGIFVATSAGNSGPSVSSSSKHSPWYTSVAFSEHGRQNAFVKQINGFTGGTNPPAAITGQSNSGNITANIVYAGDFTNPNDPGNDSAQCLQPFPANTFNGQIVVCDRGEIARVEKAENVSAGGAGGYVLANVQGGETFLANDAYVIPGIHINADDGDRLKQWLASGFNHRATITTGVASQNIDEARVDVLDSGSARGPNTTISTLAPTLTAPGVDIYSAYADQRFGHDGIDPFAGDFNYLSGSSMSSPHVAGAAALLKAAHPSWTPDNIRSALAMTAVTSVLKEDATSNADFFDMGSGRVQVDLAAQAGLVLNETRLNYLLAEPAVGGEPRSLNLPSITDNECVAICTWSRTFTATQDGVWDVSAEAFDDGLSISVSPEQFTIQAGQSQVIEVSIDSSEADKNRYVFGQLNLTADNSPALHLPISILSSIGDIPTEVSIQATRDNDSLLIEDIDAINLESFVLSPFSLVKATKVMGEIAEDSEPSDYLDDINDGVVVTQIQVQANAKRLITEIVSSSASDLDLYLVLDSNNDGQISSFEEIGQSISSNSSEEIAINYPQAGRYFIVVQSFSGSSSASDTFEMRYAVVNDEQDDSLSVQAPNALSSSQPFDMRFIHQLSDAQTGDDFYGAIEMGISSSRPNNLGLIAVDIRRIGDDIALNANKVRVEQGDSVDLTVLVAANNTNEARNYEISIPAPQGTSFSNVGSGLVNNDILSYSVNKASFDGNSSSIVFTLNVGENVTAGPVDIELSSSLQGRSHDSSALIKPTQAIQIEGPPSIDFNGNPSTTLNVFETQTLIIPINIVEPNNDAVSLSFTQIAGPQTPILQDNGEVSLIAPSVDSVTELVYTVEADDGNSNVVSAEFTVNVSNNDAPVIESISAPANANGGQRVTITVSASDVESDPLTITINGVEGASLSVNVPRSGASVSYPISVSDGINTVNDQVTISLTQAAVESGSSGGGGSLPLWWLMAIALVSVFRKTRRT